MLGLLIQFARFLVQDISNHSANLDVYWRKYYLILDGHMHTWSYRFKSYTKNNSMPRHDELQQNAILQNTFVHPCRFYDDETTYDIDRQFLWGAGLMITPVLDEVSDDNYTEMIMT